MRKKALVLGGGAPNMTLMSGALYALDEKGVKFDVISTSGAGMFIGLLYVAPKGISSQQALKNVVDVSVSDWIYQLFPVNYKVFKKPGIGAEAYRNIIKNNPWLKEITDIENPWF
jgi:NTE family protein